MKTVAITLSAAALIMASAGFSSSALALDVDAAKDLAEQNKCMQCHGLRKDKDAPAFQKIAEKFKGKAGAVDELVKHMTSGKEVELADKTKEKHKIVKTTPANDAAQQKNLAEYVLSIQPK